MSTVTDTQSYSILQDNPDLAKIITDAQLNKEKVAEYELRTKAGQILTLDSIKGNPKLFQYYTGLKIEVFQALFKYLEPKAQVMKYPHGARTVLFNHHAEATPNRKKPGKQRSTRLDEEMFYTLVKLNLGLQTKDCAVRFGMSSSRFSSIFTAWVTLLAQQLELICKMPPMTDTDSREEANCFDEFPNVRVVVDCTELFAETPSSLRVHKQFHSNYKHHSTVKFLVGMNTGGAITYISEMYGGRASDKFITNDADDFLTSLNPGEKVMADRGFTIQEDLPAGVRLVIPSFKHRDKSQFTKYELQMNKKISEARVHIERAIRRIKQFQILKNEMKLTQVEVYSNIFKACAYLVNFQDPFLKT